MKQDNTFPLDLSILRCNVVASDASDYEAGLFDDRNQFYVTDDDMIMNVNLRFINRRVLGKGIRRMVNITIIDAVTRRLMVSRRICITLAAGQYDRTYTTTLPMLSGDERTSTNPMTLIVTDEKTSRVLGEKQLMVYEAYDCEKHPGEWFKVYAGAITKKGKDDLFQSIDSIELEYNSVSFFIGSELDITKGKLPELEIRVISPYGIINNIFITPDAPASTMEGLEVTMPLFHRYYLSGVCYAELRCMNHAIGGFVFSTDGPVVRGCYGADNLRPMDHYTPEDAAERLRNSIRYGDGEEEEEPEDPTAEEPEDECADDTDSESEDLSDAEFEKLIDDFIAREIESSDDPTPDRPEDPAVNRLNHLTGLASVKEKITVYEQMARFNKMRVDAGLSDNTAPLHAMFLGSPGTGKTTVAGIMGEMLRQAGILSKGHVVVRERATLLGPNYSNEETNTLKAIEEAQGGILLIDEAYQLCPPNDPKDPGKFVIETLMTILADESHRDWMLILAGYPDKMQNLFEINPGLRSRIPESNIYTFEDFTSQELMEIAERYFERHNYILNEKAQEALRQRLEADYACRSITFGNARHVLNLIQTRILPAMAVRVMQSGKTDELALKSILPEDIPLPEKVIQAHNSRIGFIA